MESGAELYQIITETRSASMSTLALVDSTGHRTLAFSEEAAVWARDAARLRLGPTATGLVGRYCLSRNITSIIS